MRPGAAGAGRKAACRLQAFRQPFWFFVNSRTGCGNLIYHGYDSHYALIESAD